MSCSSCRRARKRFTRRRRGRAIAEVYRLTAAAGAPARRADRPWANGSATGRVRVVHDVKALESVQAGEVLVAEMTDPDWEPVMRRVAAIVTDKGGRTAHAAIVSREFGLPCIVGTDTATRTLHDGDEVTVCCAEGAEGQVYAGRVPFQVDHVDVSSVPDTHTKVMLIVGDPSRAFDLSRIPNQGVGLARAEFIITNHIGIHPMALVRYPQLKDPAVGHCDRRHGSAAKTPRRFFVSRFSEGIARIAAAFYPKPVIVRMSDFKTNEYAQLLGGQEFEPAEENPMIGFRGASRYYDDRYAEGFALECAALLRVRAEIGLTNVKVMIPFCRTVEEGKRVIAAMAPMACARATTASRSTPCARCPRTRSSPKSSCRVFDGFSIGSNDLTQLTLGLDRDSGTVAHLFDERNDAVRWLIARAIAAARRPESRSASVGRRRPTILNSPSGWSPRALTRSR